MSHITTLVQRMKAAAQETKADGDNVCDLHVDDVLALVEALEAKDKRIAELVKSRKSWADLAGDIEKQRKSWAESAIEMGKLADDKDKRITELVKSITVTVKLYDDFQLCHYGTTEDYAKGYIDCQNNFTKWLAAAGIKVIEGEVR
ncbi:hypothetical protein AU577_24320 [Salmonella enterica subsp. enterica serovar Alachua]|nr:hypothetical protein [Salmonella enterica subsp. enterica serovar Alachua]